MQIDSVRINVGISIGFALAPDDATEASALLQRADVAMYGAKAGFGEGVNFYSVEGDTNTPRRLALTSDLGAAISNGQLTVLYQPKLRFSDGQITGFEALVRWEHPEFGLVGPDEFIPIAERTGTIQQLTEAVLGTAVAQIVEWRRENKPWGVSVNLSMRNLLDPAICTTVQTLLRESDVDPAGLTLELTESSVMSDTSRTISVLEELARSGVKLSIDDFGTGYSSLAYLQRLPVDEVKIDKSFVLPMSSDPGAEAIVRSILDLARNMQLRVVAEGVEDRPTWELLGRLGCHEGQGHFMGSPAAPDQIDALVAQVQVLGLVVQQDSGGTVNDLWMAASPGSS